MSTPQQPELRRSEKLSTFTPDAVAGDLQARHQPGSDGNHGPVPAANQAGGPSGPVQDKPDLDAFAARLGTKNSGTQPSPARSSHTQDGDASPWYQAKQVMLGGTALAAGGLLYAVARARRALK